MRTTGYSVAKSKILFIRFSYLFGSVLTVLLKIRYLNCSFRKSIFTTNTFQGIQYFNSFSISVVLDFYIRSLFNGSERGHCASNTSARRDVTIDDVIIRTPDVMCEWLTRRTRYIPNFICLACKLIAL